MPLKHKNNIKLHTIGYLTFVGSFWLKVEVSLLCHVDVNWLDEARMV